MGKVTQEAHQYVVSSFFWHQLFCEYTLFSTIKIWGRMDATVVYGGADTPLTYQGKFCIGENHDIFFWRGEGQGVNVKQLSLQGAERLWFSLSEEVALQEAAVLNNFFS